MVSKQRLQELIDGWTDDVPSSTQGPQVQESADSFNPTFSNPSNSSSANEQFVNSRSNAARSQMINPHIQVPQQPHFFPQQQDQGQNKTSISIDFMRITLQQNTAMPPSQSPGQPSTNTAPNQVAQQVSQNMLNSNQLSQWVQANANGQGQQFMLPNQAQMQQQFYPQYMMPNNFNGFQAGMPNYMNLGSGFMNQNMSNTNQPVPFLGNPQLPMN